MKILLDVHTHTVASGHAFSTLQEMVRTAADIFSEFTGSAAADVRGGTLIRRRDKYSRL